MRSQFEMATLQGMCWQSNWILESEKRYFWRILGWIYEPGRSTQVFSKICIYSRTSHNVKKVILFGIFRGDFLKLNLQNLTLYRRVHFFTKRKKLTKKLHPKKVQSRQQMIEVYQPIDESDVLLIHSIFRLILCHYAM
jgi:hypothetical protein